MKLVVHELTASGIIQELTPDKNLILAAVRPHIYRHNWPTGSLKVQVLNASDDVIAESEEISISNIGSQNFFHGYVRFLVSVGLQKDETYKFKLVGTNGYAFSESAYCGACNDFDLRKYSPNYSPAEGLRAPIDLEVWTLSPR